MFDYCLAIALLYFKEQNCGLVILETGLGGRLDSTNVIEAPLVSVITRIGYDHTNLLGETLGEIAAEKAGILKRGTRAVLGGQTAEAMDVLKEHLHKLSIPYRCVETDRITSVPGGFCYPGEEPYQMQMLGVHQRIIQKMFRLKRPVRFGRDRGNFICQREHFFQHLVIIFICQNPYDKMKFFPGIQSHQALFQCTGSVRIMCAVNHQKRLFAQQFHSARPNSVWSHGRPCSCVRAIQNKPDMHP